LHFIKNKDILSRLIQFNYVVFLQSRQKSLHFIKNKNFPTRGPRVTIFFLNKGHRCNFESITFEFYIIVNHERQ